MELTTPANPASFSAKLVTSLNRKFRSNKQYTQAAIDRRNAKESAKAVKLRKRNPTAAANEGANELGERTEYAIFGNGRPKDVDDAKGKDHGEMMHNLAHRDSSDSLRAHPRRSIEHDAPAPTTVRKRRRRGMLVSPEHESRVASLPDELWKRVAVMLGPADAVRLATASKTLHQKIGPLPFHLLNHHDHRRDKHAFLHAMDGEYPDQLLCFPCGKYHKRLQPGKEMLKIDYVTNPVFRCPNVKASVLPRMRITYGRELPYAYLQLALRAARHGPSYGIDVDTLSRRWKCKDSGWTHRTRYMVHDDHLLFRCVSQTFVPPGPEVTESRERQILYDREEFQPFFSVCAHWRDGDLMKICKCIMSHVPAAPEPYARQLRRGLKLSRAAAHPHLLVRGCDDCRPARRCPECPSEYLVEIQMREDPSDRAAPFKHALVVTRWSDLGDGSSPYTSPEWAACTGARAPPYRSFSAVGRRAVAGIFESAVSGAIPGQRLISLNPANKRLGEHGHGWY